MLLQSITTSSISNIKVSNLCIYKKSCFTLFLQQNLSLVVDTV